MFMNNGEDIFRHGYKMLLSVSYQQNTEGLNFIDLMGLYSESKVTCPY